MSLIPREVMGFNTRKIGAVVGAVVIFALLARVALATDPWTATGPGNVTANGTADANDLDGLVGALFTDHVIALEVLGILLTAAMIGALVIARPLGAPDDSTHYGAGHQADADEAVHDAAVRASIAAEAARLEEEE